MNVESVAVMSPASIWLENFKRNWLILFQLLLVVAVVHLYEIEGDPFSKVIILACAGFLVSISLPLAQRLPFFVMLSIAGIFWVLGPTDGLFLILLGLALIGIANLPVPGRYRIILLLLVTVILAVSRSGIGSAPWSSALWPILGSMFMFRLVLYVRAVNSGQVEHGVWNSLAYFFMLPNVAFPLFPVVDYQTFQRTHFDQEETAIYQTGMLWITRGLVHLVLYRYIYHYALEDPNDVVTLSDLVQYMLGTLLLYLKVSGQFHIITGVLHLFGFRVPETHKLYFLAHSFTELWRRINIYWTDFMMKVVFYPTYFKVKQYGPTKALVISTAVVFFGTWILHSYQWFWLRGGFPITVQDTLFWGVLGALVIRSALKEMKAVRKPQKNLPVWDWRRGASSAVTFVIFCFLWSLWSTHSFAQWVWLLGASANVDMKGILLIVLAFSVICFLGGWNPDAKKSGRSWLAFGGNHSVRIFAPMIILLLLTLPTIQQGMPVGWVSTLESLQTARLNKLDAAAQHRGYYEQLDIRDTLNSPEVNEQGASRDNWQTPASVGVINERNDILTRDLYPNLKVMWNGNNFTTNRFGMRDQDYAQKKPANTLRIAFLGPSHVMGNGVADDETFENLIETRINEQSIPPGYEKVEILNFGVDGYSIPQQLAILENRVFDFEPDIVIVTVYHQTMTMTRAYLQKLINRDVTPLHEGLSALFASAGLSDIDRGKFPVPYQTLRDFLGGLGISTRMPSVELEARVHRIAPDVDSWAIQKMVKMMEEHNVKPIMLALNVVLDQYPDQIPNHAVIQKVGMPFINLFDIFPEEKRSSLRVAPWDDHPNAEGHRIIADRLYQELVPIMGQLTTRSN